MASDGKGSYPISSVCLKDVSVLSYTGNLGCSRRMFVSILKLNFEEIMMYFGLRSGSFVVKPIA